MTQLIIYSLIGGLFSLVGGLALLVREDLAKKIITPLLAFAAGSFLGVSFLDLLPEAVESVSEVHPVFIATLVGFGAFFTLERLIMRYFSGHSHDHNHSEHTESLPFLVVLGDTLHNFLDGIVIALAFIANPSLGLVTALAIAAHEIPQEIGDFAILLSQGWGKGKIILVNILSSLVTVLGVLLGTWGGLRLEPHLPLLLGGVAGVFIYIASSDLIPEVHHRAGHKHIGRVLLPFILSLVSIGYLVALTHG